MVINQFFQINAAKVQDYIFTSSIWFFSYDSTGYHVKTAENTIALIKY
jgi:hypothetical protein